MRAFRGEADFGETQEDEAEDGRGVFLGLEVGVGAELVGSVPEALFGRGAIRFFFGWGDPVHGVGPQGISNGCARNTGNRET